MKKETKAELNDKVPTINGKPDTDIIADMIVKKILIESIVKYHGTRLGNDEVKELDKYVKEKLENIIEYTKHNCI